MDNTQAEEQADLEVSSLKHLTPMATQDGESSEVQVLRLMPASLSKTMTSVSDRAH